jgi:ferredoxin, 2Fe-2S
MTSTISNDIRRVWRAGLAIQNARKRGTNVPKVTLNYPNGEVRTLPVGDGQSVMKAATANMVPGIIGECGGELTCATCHVYVEPEWLGRLPAREQDEVDMLDLTSEEPTKCSRLSCQIVMSPDLDGLVLHLPKTQR